MTDDEAKFDVRVRQRLVSSGVLKESEIEKHLEGLRDVGDQAVSVVAKQPALQSESDRDIVIVRTSGVRPPPTPPRLDDDLESTPIDDDLDDDDDDDDDVPVTKKPAVAEKPAAERPAPSAETVEDDEDDEDDEDGDGEEGSGEEGSGEEGGGDGEKKKEVDDGWGESTT
jgi:hypothetical protein